ncbi:MAG: hypothetical protein AAFS10_10785 [Myxococcota bacterium]
MNTYLSPTLICTLLLATFFWSSSAVAQPATPPQNTPGTWALDAKPDIDLEAQMFSGYRYEDTSAEDFNAFDITRAELGTWLRFNPHLGGEMRIEAIRSAGPQSLLGVDGDSLVLRVKRAWAYTRTKAGPVLLDVRAGLIPDPWVDTLEMGYDLRGISPTAGELSLFFDTSDLGASLIVQLFDGLAQLQVAATNGEGRNQAEQNNGKNTTAVLSVSPLRLKLKGEEAVLTLLGFYRDGSIGVGKVRSNRLGGGVTFVSAYGWAGAEYIQADGVFGREQTGSALAAWANVPILANWLGVVGRYDLINTDTDANDATRTILSGGLYSDLVYPGRPPDPTRFRIYLLAQSEEVGDDAAPAPGAPEIASANRVLILFDIGARATISNSGPRSGRGAP